jgi:Fur family peroxide stress response transcriptional regulator
MASSKKFSYKREAILRTIRSTDSHPSADWVYSQLRTEIPNLSLGTVYRNIALFKDEGLIMTVGVVDGQERYDGDIHPHPHFICERCGRIIDVVYDLDSDACRILGEKYGFDVTRQNHSFYGYCDVCRSNRVSEHWL